MQIGSPNGTSLQVFTELGPWFIDLLPVRFKFETKATDVYKRGLVGKGRDFFQLKENSHVQFSKNEDILHNYFYKYLNEKKTHWMPHLAGEIIVNAQGSVV